MEKKLNPGTAYVFGFTEVHSKAAGQKHTQLHPGGTGLGCSC